MRVGAGICGRGLIGGAPPSRRGEVVVVGGKDRHGVPGWKNGVFIPSRGWRLTRAVEVREQTNIDRSRWSMWSGHCEMD